MGTQRGVAIVAGGALLWTLVMVIGAGSGPDDDLWLESQRMGDLWTVAFLVIVSLSLVFVILARPVGRPGIRDARRQRPWFFLVALVAAYAFVLFRPEVSGVFDGISLEAESVEGTAPVAVDEADVEPRTVGELGAMLFVLLGIGVVAAIGLGVAQSRRTNDDEFQGPITLERYHQALADAYEQLELGTDPRSSVLAAYARAERSLSGHAGHRVRSEAAGEYLDRALTQTGFDPIPFQTLSGLYHRARFSSAPITVEDQERARLAFDHAMRAAEGTP